MKMCCSTPGFHTIRFFGYMEWISDIWNSVEAVDVEELVQLVQPWPPGPCPWWLTWSSWPWWFWGPFPWLRLRFFEAFEECHGLLQGVLGRKRNVRQNPSSWHYDRMFPDSKNIIFIWFICARSTTRLIFVRKYYYPGNRLVHVAPFQDQNMY